MLDRKALLEPYANVPCPAIERIADHGAEDIVWRCCDGSNFDSRFDPLRGKRHEIARTFISVNKDDPEWGDLEVAYCVHCEANDLDGGVPPICFHTDLSALVDVFMNCGYELLFMTDRDPDLPGPPFRVHWRRSGMNTWLGASVADTKVDALALAFPMAISLSVAREKQS